MKKWFLFFLLISPTVARAELVTPNFTQGSMQSTTTTYVSALNKWTGENITHTSGSSGGIADSDSIFTLHTAGDPFELEIVTRAASQVLSVEVIDREIDVTSTTVSLSVFSQ